MTSQPGYQTVTTHILRNILPSKEKQTMTFGHVIEYNKINFFSKNYAETEVGKLVRVFFFFFKKLSLR